jgi:LacI family transcriptional regulator
LPGWRAFHAAFVDRVYHSRGYVKAEKAERVRQLLAQFEYRPNKLARALSVSQNKKRIAVILNSIGNEYFDDVILGIERAARDYAGYGLSVEISRLKALRRLTRSRPSPVASNRVVMRWS